MASCVARQPIFHTDMSIYGYELLYRNTERSVSYDSIDGDFASSQTIMNSFHEIGVERVTNGKRAFINFTEKLLLDDVASILPNKILVVELLENILPTPEVIAECKKLRSDGYKIALDDFRLDPEYRPLVEVADIIKIDFIETSRSKMEEFVYSLRDSDIVLLAEKIETYEEFEFAKNLGFKLFQGYFFSKPMLVSSSVTMTPLRVNCLQLIRLASDPNMNFTKIAAVLKRDVTLTYRLLRVVNSAYFGMRYTVKNIKQALAILGMKEVYKWVTLISLSEISSDKPDELIILSLIRARFLELLAPNVGASKHAEDLFMLGLMSLMDAITDTSFDELEKLTQISPEIIAAITTKEGKYGELLSMIIQYELSEWDTAFELAAKYDIGEVELIETYLTAVDWANSFPL